MADKKHKNPLEAELSGILARFDTDTKEDLGAEVFEHFDLEEDRSFAAQLSRQLNRKLNADEAFKLDVLYRAYKFHDESNEEMEE